MSILYLIAAFGAGMTVCWFFKGALQADITLLHAKIDGILAAVRGK